MARRTSSMVSERQPHEPIWPTFFNISYTAECLFKFLTTCTWICSNTFQTDCSQELLHLHITQSTASVMCFQLVQVSIFRQITSKMFCLAESIQVKNTQLPSSLPGSLTLICVGSVHALHFLQYLICRIRQIDTVAQRLTHLSLSIRTRQTQTNRIIRKKDFRFYQCFAIDMVETAYNLTCLFNHRFLVFSHRNSSSLECCNIGSLADRISKKPTGILVSKLRIWISVFTVGLRCKRDTVTKSIK